MAQFESFIGVNFWTALFTLLNFLALFFVAKKYLYKPVMDMIQTRQQEIDEMYADANAAKDQARQLESEYQQKLSDATQTGEQIVKAAVARGQAREEEILRQASSEAAAMLDKATQDIALERQKAISDAKEEISDIALSIAEKVVGRELKDADQQALVDSFIDRLGDAT